MSESAACRHETLPSQWRVLSRKAVPEEMGLKPMVFAGYRNPIIAPFGDGGKPRSCLEIAHIQQFRAYVLDWSGRNIGIP
jgi:hypothetical protein